MAHHTAPNNDTNNDRPDGPPGAPKASYVKEVLVTLRDRLEAQVNDVNDRDPVMVRNLLANVRDRLKQINEALVQIEEDKYGVCANCLSPIAAERLVARPYSTLCTDCQNRLERGEREPN
ncbi:MAG: TraR/DksA family transcriptional regulator [Chloroflexota bacterium]